MSLIKPRGSSKKKTLLRNAEDLLLEKVEQNYDVDLTRIGIVWSGILELDTPIPASEVAAMLSSVSLIRATTLVESEEHWTTAAAYAALGHAAEVDLSPAEDDSDVPDEKAINPIGFSPKA
jgi:hypothetical protein